jgi:hypothetical protein
MGGYVRHCVVLAFGVLGLRAQVVVNEVMPVPPTGEPEWVELFNTADSAVALEGWWIADLKSMVQLPALRLPPRGYAVLTRDTAALLEARAIPPEAVLVELRLPTLNNTTDAVVLRRPDSAVVDSLFYSMRWGRAGVSLERRLATEPAHASSNVQPSIAPAGATPGAVNSVTPLPADFALAGVVVRGLPPRLEITVRNTGEQLPQAASVTLWIAREGQWQLRQQWQLPVLFPGEQRTVGEELGSLFSAQEMGRRYRYRAAVTAAEDPRRWNDTSEGELFASAELLPVRINEILYEPHPGEPEFVELVNLHRDTVDLAGWTLEDASGRLVRIGEGIRIAPGQFAVIASDSTITTKHPQAKTNLTTSKNLMLNNNGDLLLLRDPNGVVVDSLYYLPSWHDPFLSGATRGISLEKLNPALPSAAASSWSSCGAPEGATPGLPNSIAVPLSGGGEVQVAPAPFRLHAGQRAYCLVQYHLPFRQALLTARVYSEQGELVRTLAHVTYTAAEGSLVWDGRTEQGEMVPPGAYILLLEARDRESGREYRSRSLIVVTQ